jgi:hypothetical protein
MTESTTTTKVWYIKSVYFKTIQQKFDSLQIPVNLPYVYYQNLRSTRSELQERKNRLFEAVRQPSERGQDNRDGGAAKQKATIIHPQTSPCFAKTRLQL